MTVRKRSVVAALAIGVLAVTSACAEGNQGAPATSSGSSNGASSAPVAAYKPAVITLGTAEDSKGPAIPPEGVVKGGTVTMIDRDDFSHLDPAQIYVNTEANFGRLIARGLTGYKRVAKGEFKLVGDLATDPGTPSDGGKTWKFTLKDGVKWQDGTPITSADVKWSMERTFAPFVTQGPTYIQQWLTDVDFKKAYPGPYDGKELDAIETPDDKTIIYKFKSPHADANYAFAMAGYAIVPKAKDTKEQYDKEPVSSGPYIIKSHVVDKTMDLERNPHWDPATDPIRGAYPDKWHLEFGFEALQVTDRLMADSGADQTAFTFYASTPPERLQQVLGDANLASRRMNSPSPYGNYYYFNLDRVKDIKIRQAINYAWPSKQIQQVMGGPAAAALPVIFGPIAEGAPNYSHLKDPALTAEMDKITAMTDINAANAAWMALDKKVQETITPLVVAENRIATMLHGSKVGGAEIDPQQWIVQPDTIFVKP
ncbi:ABC transporter substrate-binding protein [Streptosporangium algeriense]|uniref:ABC transporter substrate-binding protein n=1 Tax=Streptosporangium algeriense TaxID=1682748 RepID=A0ABW3DM89_9ACTN